MTELERSYSDRYSLALEPAAPLLMAMILDYFKGYPRIDRISVRPKSIDSFLVKASAQENGKRKYEDPMVQITDQLGARVVCFYNDDVEPASAQALKYFTPVEIEEIIPIHESEFGYFGKHFLFLVPSDICCSIPREDLMPSYFELQIKTLYEHAWAEANHDIAYKPHRKLSSDDKRRVAFTAAQSWGADVIFNELKRTLG